MSEILLVEDDPEDVELTLLTLRRAVGTRPVVVVHNGVQALDYLNAAGNFKSRDAAALPALVLLDLKMPLMDGFEFLRQLREQWGPGWRGLRIAILSSSDEERDRAAAQALGIKEYFRKPISAPQSAELAAAVTRLLNSGSYQAP